MIPRFHRLAFRGLPSDWSCLGLDRSRRLVLGLLWLWSTSMPGAFAAATIPDPRHIHNGWAIPSEGYADQPYIVKTDDGAWLCVMTTGQGAEGAAGQHVVFLRSTDRGRTWEKPVPIEPSDGPEASYAVLLKVPYGRIYCVYRTIDGWPASAYSRDGGHTWTKPVYASYTPDGRRIKHPRAANFAWNCGNGRYLYWFHNHGGRFIGALGASGRGGRSPYDDRNPAWLMAGREIASPQGLMLEWSQPEILLYDDDPFIRRGFG